MIEDQAQEGLPKTVAFLSPQGGTGKSTLARALAVYYLNQGVRVKLADCSPGINSCFDFALRRKEAGIQPALQVEMFVSAEEAVAWGAGSDILILDGGPSWDKFVIDMALVADLIVIPVRTSESELAKQISFAKEIANRGACRRPFFVIARAHAKTKVPDINVREAIRAESQEAAQTHIVYSSAYMAASSIGKSLVEVSQPSLREPPERLMREIDSKLNSLEQ